MKINYLAPTIGKFDVLNERGFAGTGFGNPGRPGGSGIFGGVEGEDNDF